MPVTKIGDLPLAGGGVLKDAKVAYETLGTLNAAKDNVVLVGHGGTSGPDSILPVGDALEGSWCDLVGPRCHVDTNRFFVICPNAIGSSFGSTGPGSINPETGRPYGPDFPEIALSDIVESQCRLLDALGIGHLHAVAGASFGGFQALQWAVDHPDRMSRVVAATASIGPPPDITAQLRAQLAADPNWNGGNFYAAGGVTETLVKMRIDTLKSFGLETALAATVPDESERARLLEERARRWSGRFDANALLTIFSAMARFDVSADLGKIEAPVLFALSRTDIFFPPFLAESTLAAFEKAGVKAKYLLIDSDLGHAASSADADLWGPELSRFLSD